jgi:hypothetical protein
MIKLHPGRNLAVDLDPYPAMSLDLVPTRADGAVAVVEATAPEPAAGLAIYGDVEAE